ncbi:MAG TPA: DUF2804 domain-containing protein [Candidatus Anoxymicrobiaceae bacterium]
MRDRKPTPPRMIVDGQVAEYGAFVEPFREVNLLDIDLVMRGRHAPRMVRDFRLKEWEHFGIITDEYYFGMVIFDAKFMGTSFFYAYDRKTGEFFEHERTSVGGPVRVSRELWHGECYFRHYGYNMEFENRLDSGLHRLRVDIAAKKGKPPINAEIYMLENLERLEPLVVVSPISDNRPLFTHKAAAPVEGRIMIGDKEIRLHPEKDVALMDVQKTFYPYRTFWNWATFGGHDEFGSFIAMNACQNFITDDAVYNENCTWVDGKITLLGSVKFEFDKGDLMKPWKIYAPDGGLDLTFKPQGKRVGRVNLGVVMSDFNQPFGTFSGTMAGPGGSTVEVDAPFGLCEWHLARF